ncbi:MAG: zinc ribbon domain-containing protein, partial [Bacteroidales bacterium]|nr:zinc ribbon domain-containing protein [Bacteroidales bacterium]
MKPSCKIIECELCHTENPSTAIFCKHCGNHFDNKPIATIKCKHCNTYNPFFAKYCKKCGKQLQTKNTTFITWIWILAIILIISIIICIFQVIDKHNLESKYKSQLG